MTGARAARAVPLALGGLVVAVPFFAATTFVGDDHLFLAFARHAPNPFLPFVVDQHGGEYYRPLPMLVWWLLGRAGGGAPAPFAALALLLHATAAALVASLLGAVGRPRAVAAAAAALMFIAPQNLQAAYWFAASTDLFATVFVLGSLVSLTRRRVLVSALLALAAYLCKESALVLPLLALVTLAAAGGEPWRRRLALVAPHVALVTVVLVVRTLVLRGPGGSGDARAGGLGRALQIAAGFFHIFTGEAFVPELLAFGVGAAVIALAALAAFRRPAVRSPPFLFAAVAALPLGAAGWAVGARYFYLPSVGVVWAVAEAVVALGPAAQLTAAVLLLLLGAAQAAERRQDTVSYDRRVAAARRAVGEGVAAGHRVFHIDGGIKDLDLAVKEAPSLAGAANDLLVLNDVPASFAIIPPPLASAAAIVVAAPPVPPSGAYRFGDAPVVGLARRGDEPSLDEVVARFPDIRFIRLRPTPTGRVIARDLTDEIKRRLDGLEPDGQN